MTARLHHYIPRCYLKGFAKSRTKHGQLFVVDGKTKKAFVTTSRNIAAEKDFNRLDIPGVPPDAWEVGMSRFETELDKALERIIASASFRDTSDRALVFSFIGLLAVHNPRWREIMRGAMEQTARIIMDATLADPAQYQAQLNKARNAGFVTGPDVSYEEMKEFVEKQQYRITVPNNRQIDRVVKQQVAILPFLFGRKWILLKAAAGSGTFMTSDHPVCLLWSNPEERGGFYPPGFGLKGTDVLFPLCKNLAIVGRFEGEESEHTLGASAVAGFNGAQVAFAQRQVFAMDQRVGYALSPHEPRRFVGDLVDDPRFTDRIVGLRG